MPELIDKDMEALLPPENPPFYPKDKAGQKREGELEGYEYSERDLLRRSLLWSVFLQVVFEVESWDMQIPGFQFATFGFIPIANPYAAGIQSSGGFVFGTAVEVESHGDIGQELHRFADLHWDREFKTEFDERLILVINRHQFEEHAPHPVAGVGCSNQSGTSTCWARSNKQMIRPYAEGVLTAAHVVKGLPLGAAVGVSDNNSWYLGDRGAGAVDAALIVRSAALPPNATPLTVETNPIPGQNVEFTGNASVNTIRTKVTHALVRPTYLKAGAPQRVFFGQAGQPGDSGALVSDPVSNKGVGIYVGPATLSNGVVEGMSQALEQARYLLNLDLSL